MTGKERREQLLDVGRSLFAQKGFDATSVEEIAAKAGVSKPVVYEHFGGKEGLYAVVVDREMRALLDAITGALTSSGHPRDLLERAAFALLDYVETSSDGFRILVRDSPVAQSTGTFASLISDAASQVEHIMANQFKDARLRRQARADVRADARRHGRAHRPVVAGRPQARRRPTSPRTWSTSPGTACPASRPKPGLHDGTRPLTLRALERLHQLEPVAVGVGDVAAAEAGERRRPSSTSTPCAASRSATPSGPRPACPGCALRAGRKSSSTPRCSSSAPDRNQAPPRAASTGGLGTSVMPSTVAVELPQHLLGPARRGELHVVQPDQAGHAAARLGDDEDAPERQHRAPRAAPGTPARSQAP